MHVRKAKCKFCDEGLIIPHQLAAVCPNCWEVRWRMPNFLKSKKNAEWLRSIASRIIPPVKVKLGNRKNKRK